MFGTTAPTIDEYLPVDEDVEPYVPVPINDVYNYGSIYLSIRYFLFLYCYYIFSHICEEQKMRVGLAKHVNRIDQGQQSRQHR